MALKSHLWNRIPGLAMIVCAGFIFNIAIPSAFAQTVFYAGASSEAISHWDSSKMIETEEYANGYGEASLDYSYSPTEGLPPGGFFTASAHVHSEFGQMQFYADFSESLPAGSNVSLADATGRLSWLNNPLAVSGSMLDTIIVNGPEAAYDLMFPIQMDGTFTKNGTEDCVGVECGNPLGLTGEVQLNARFKLPSGSYKIGYSNIPDSQFSSGLYYITVKNVPSNTKLPFMLSAGARFNLIDTVDYSSLPSGEINYKDPESIYASITGSVSQRTGSSYSLSGAADFSHTVSFGSFFALKDGVGQPNVTITSAFPNGMVYAPATVPIVIDIKPGSSPASINAASKGKTPVAVLSSPTFDALSMTDTKTLTFGSTGDEHSLAFCNPNGEDVNGDGLVDLVCHFDTRQAGFRPNDTQGILRGKTSNNLPIEGSDSVRIIR
jgi:hypothetical protein